MKKRLISMLLAVCMITALLPTLGMTAFAADTMTRAEWISQLVKTFDMTVEDDSNIPDNYFSDIAEDDSYYRNILLAVEFGVIELEEGEAFEPNEPATREFVAQTLNYALQFQLDEDAEYTYSEADSVTYPDDIQVAINRGWFVLSGGNFLPDKAITSTEATAMLNDAKAVLASDEIDENYNSTYEFADGVIEIPETVNAVINADSTVTIIDYETEINTGDVFVVYTSGLPVTFKATAVEVGENTTVISTTKDGAEDAIVSADAEGVIDLDFENFEFDEVTTYSITDTSKPNAASEELTIELMEANFDVSTKTLTASKKVSVGDLAAGSISVTMKNLHFEYNAANSEVVLVSDDTSISSNISFDFGNYAGIPSTLSIGSVGIPGVASVTLAMEYSLKSGLTYTWQGKVKVGFSRSGGSWHMVREFTKKSADLSGNAEVKAGLRLFAELDIFFAEGSIWAAIGVKIGVDIKPYDSGEPKRCVTTKGYIYANVGVSARIKNPIPGITVVPPYNDTKEIFTESNSPLRVVYHYEDDKLVSSCTRGMSLKYTTSTSSKHFNPYYGQGSYGGGSGGSGSEEPVVIWEYTVDGANNATITKYNGNASAVAIPSSIDGYTVTKIGTSAFANNTSIRTVSIPNTVIEIYNRAFLGCTNLSSINFSKNLEALGNRAFWECSSLVEIEIPKSLTKTIYDSYASGPFNNSGLVSVTFEDGTTQVISTLFEGASHLKNVTLVDTITKIGTSAFKDCISLKDIQIPDSVTEIGTRAFWECTNLSSVKLSKNLDALGNLAFWKCSSLTEIEIPKSLTQTLYDGYDSGPFNSSGLKVATFENGTTQVVTGLFKGAKNLENVILLDTMTNIGNSAFRECTALHDISIPDSVTKISTSAFQDCTALENILIPDSVTEIENRAFWGCVKLSNVKLSKNLYALGNLAFKECNSLTDIEIPKSLTQTLYDSYDSGPFNGSALKTATFEQGTTQIIGDLFKGAANLENITLLDTMTSVGNSVFRDCTALKNINLPESIDKIGNNAFQGCILLKNILIPNSVLTMGNYIFSDCTSLEKVKLPDTVQHITQRMFNNCINLTDIPIPATVTTIEAGAFYGCTKLPEITIPETVTSIGSSAFYECKALEEITIPETVTSIGSSAFENCDSLQTVIVNGSGSIGQKAFYDCDGLTTLMLGNGVTSIGSNMCYSCDSLTNITFGIGLTTIPDSAFRLCTSLQEVILPRYCTKIESNAFAEDTKLTTVTVLQDMTAIENNSFSYPTRMTMRGVSGSYAQEYANSRNMTFEPINIPMTTLEFYKGEIEFSGTNRTAVLPLTIAPLDSTDTITYTSADEKIATVVNGVVTSKGYGSTTITVVSDSGKRDTITVNVLRSANSVSLDKTSLSLEVGDTETLTATMSPSDATDKITWATSNSNVATVDNGTVTAVGIGTAVITATTTSGKTATCTVKVTGTLTITATAGENGTISPSGEVAIRSDEQVTFTMLPAYGYVVKDVLVNGVSVGAVESYTFKNLTDNATITAEFAKVNVSYEDGTITISSDAALKDLKLIVATYEDGALTNCEVKTVAAAAGAEYQESVVIDDNTKVMLWNGLNSMRPIWKSE